MKNYYPGSAAHPAAADTTAAHSFQPLMFMMASTMLLTFTSCFGPLREDAAMTDSTRLTLLMDGDFKSQTRTAATTRSTSLQDSQLTDLWLYDYDAATSELLQSQHLTEGFDAPELTLRRGQHSISIIASRGTTPSATDEAIDWIKPHDTFAAILSVTAEGEDVSESVTLQRRVARVTLNILDLIPAEATTLEWVFSDWSSTIDPATTYAPATEEYTYLTNMVPMRGYTGVNVSAYALAPSSSAWQTALSIRVLDADNEPIATATIPAISLLQNRTTTLRGNLFASGGTLSIGLDDAWSEGIELTF